MEHFFKIALLTLLVLGIVTNILMIGKDRKPVTPASAVVSLIINAIFITAIFVYWK